MYIWVFRVVMLGIIIILTTMQSSNPCDQYNVYGDPNTSCEVLEVYEPVWTCEGPDGFGSPC